MCLEMLRTSASSVHDDPAKLSSACLFASTPAKASCFFLSAPAFRTFFAFSFRFMYRSMCSSASRFDSISISLANLNASTSSRKSCRFAAFTLLADAVAGCALSFCGSFTAKPNFFPTQLYSSVSKTSHFGLDLIPRYRFSRVVNWFSVSIQMRESQKEMQVNMDSLLLISKTGVARAGFTVLAPAYANKDFQIITMESSAFRHGERFLVFRVVTSWLILVQMIFAAVAMCSCTSLGSSCGFGSLSRWNQGLGRLSSARDRRPPKNALARK
mmetsp:Transcript_26996/g.68000  ORF Transcript_26996/g.68000 Transcript_26996/m.68000 type:complete len:271 (-) Transcript_26996:4605-5417(-)